MKLPKRRILSQIYIFPWLNGMFSKFWLPMDVIQPCFLSNRAFSFSIFSSCTYPGTRLIFYLKKMYKRTYIMFYFNPLLYWHAKNSFIFYQFCYSKIFIVFKYMALKRVGLLSSYLTSILVFFSAFRSAHETAARRVGRAVSETSTSVVGTSCPRHTSFSLTFRDTNFQDKKVHRR